MNKFLLFLLLVFFVGCSSKQPPIRRPMQTPKAPPKVVQQSSLVKPKAELPTMPDAVQERRVQAPWESWSNESFGFLELEQANKLAKRGELVRAVELFERVERENATNPVSRQVFLRRIGTLLKLGQSAQVLSLVSSRQNEFGPSLEQMDPRIALVVSYAYEHKKDFDQSMAWLGVALRGLRSHEIDLRERIHKSIVYKLRALSKEKFEEATVRWNNDPSIGVFVLEERLRRLKGEPPDTPDTINWYTAETYGELSPIGSWSSAVMSPSAFPSDTQGSPNQITIGVLLPLTGQYADHALRVKRGVELAAEIASASGGSVNLVFGDTQGEPAVAVKEYERLVFEQKAVVVLGPLLARTADAVGMRSEALNVPVLTFTKKPDLPNLGRTVFRLGVTPEGQAAELVEYGTGQLGVKNFILLSPQSPSGQEFAQAFRTEAARKGIPIAADITYFGSADESARSKLTMLERSEATAVMVADAIPNVAPLLEHIKTTNIKDAVFFGTAQWDDSVSLRGYGQLLEGAVYVTPYFALSTRAEVAEFLSNYRRKYAVDSDLLGAQAFDATQFILGRFAGEKLSSQELTTRIKQADTYPGVTGRLQVSPSGEISRRMSVVRVQNGSVIEVMFGGVQLGVLPDGEEKNF